MLKNARIKTKLLVLVSIPTVLLLYFAVSLSISKIEEYREFRYTDAVVDAAIGAGNLVHELQRERGMSAGFVGSKGSRFATELVQQRKATDAALDNLRGELGELAQKRYAASLERLLRDASAALDGIGATRDGVSALRTKDLIAIMAEMSDLSQQNRLSGDNTREVSQMLAEKALLLQGELGQFRVA